MTLWTEKLQPVFICGFGRPSMQFVHALFDGHPQAVIIPALLKFHLEWRVREMARMAPEQIVRTWQRIPNLKLELHNRNPRGAKVDPQSARQWSVDAGRFGEIFLALLREFGHERRTVMLALHQAYAEAAGLGSEGRTHLIENAHSVRFVRDILEDFPGAKLVVLLRDPRCAYASAMRRLHQPPLVDAGRLYIDWLADGYIRTARIAEKLPPSQQLVLRSEDLGVDQANLTVRMAHFMNLPFAPSLTTPTRAGQRWLSNSGRSGGSSRDTWPHEDALIDRLVTPVANRFGYGPRSTSRAWRVLGSAGAFLPAKRQLIPYRAKRSRHVSDPVLRWASVALLPSRAFWLRSLQGYLNGRGPDLLGPDAGLLSRRLRSQTLRRAHRLGLGTHAEPLA
jgi:hypothetical protein